jgi:hypothetical protein
LAFPSGLSQCRTSATLRCELLANDARMASRNAEQCERGALGRPPILFPISQAWANFAWLSPMKRRKAATSPGSSLPRMMRSRSLRRSDRVKSVAVSSRLRFLDEVDLLEDESHRWSVLGQALKQTLALAPSQGASYLPAASVMSAENGRRPSVE